MSALYKRLDGIILLMAFMNYMNSPDSMCDENSSFYSYAHSLSQDRLEKIYLDFKNYAEEGSFIKRTLKRSSNSPVEFQDLEYTRLILTKYSLKHDSATIRLSFCMDTSIDIEVDGLLSENPKIYIAWGELTRTREILWQKNH